MRTGPALCWPADEDGSTRVLLESRHAESGRARTEALLRAGYQVAVCAGPTRLPERRCPLVTGEGCDLVEGADLIYADLDVDHAEEQEVVLAHRRQASGARVLVEVSGADTARRREEFPGVVVLGRPVDESRFLAAVAAALAIRAAVGLERSTDAVPDRS